MHATFSRMVAAYMREAGICGDAVLAAMRDYERLGSLLN